DRADRWRDLVWRGDRSSFELAVDVSLSQALRERLADNSLRRGRYQIRFGRTEDDQVGILDETFLLTDSTGRDEPRQADLLPDAAPETILESHRQQDWKTVVRKVTDGHDHFYDETGSGWDPTFPHGPQRSALANVPDDEAKFPAALRLRRLLGEGVRTVDLADRALRSSGGSDETTGGHTVDGAELGPRIVEFRRESPDAFAAWSDRLEAAGIDLSVRSERLGGEEPVVRLDFDGYELPLSSASIGTLRYLALSLLPRISDESDVLLIEEPERGLDRDRVERIDHDLARASGAQVLATTHSAALVERADDGEVLRAIRHPSGTRTVVPATELD
ncbi:MAG: AAA family ATPase, partial [Bradymonadaceae bacterium]